MTWESKASIYIGSLKCYIMEFQMVADYCYKYSMYIFSKAHENHPTSLVLMHKPNVHNTLGT